MKISHSKPFLNDDDFLSVSGVLRSAFLSSGTFNGEFADEIGKVLRKRFVLATQSGTDALTAAIFSLNIKENSVIIVPSYACSALLDAIDANSCVPHPVDISLENFGLNIDMANSVGFNVGAVIGAHMFGIPMPLHEINHNNLIEDCAQTLKARIDGRTTGEMGLLSISSFYATKLLTTGHGGAVATDREDLHKRMAVSFDHDNNAKRGKHFHFALSDYNAALGLSQIAKLDGMLEKRRAIADRYYKRLGSSLDFNGTESYSRFTVIAEQGAERLISKFNKVGIEAKRPVFKPIHRYLNLSAKNFPNTEWAYEHIVSIPIYPAMTESEIEYIELFLEKHRDEMRCRTST